MFLFAQKLVAVQVGGVILQSAFTSCIRVAYDVPHTLFDVFPNIDKIGLVACPTLLIHGWCL